MSQERESHVDTARATPVPDRGLVNTIAMTSTGHRAADVPQRDVAVDVSPPSF
jgi:hypothetical protein